MIIRLDRKFQSGVALCGTLSIDGERICDTAEHADHCLSEGSYPIIRHKCKQLGRYVPLLQLPLAEWQPRCQCCKKQHLVDSNTNLPCFCPRLAMGNGIYNRTDGAILLGQMDVPGSLIHPRDPYEALCERIRKSLDRGHEVRLVIVDRV